jgi:putative flippase GtrA
MLRREGVSGQFARFVVVGLANTALSFVAYRGLLAVGTPYLIAAPLAFAAGAVNGYVFNRRWTFAAADSARARVLYAAVQGVGAGLTSVLVLLLVRAAETGKAEAYLAAIPPVTVAMFAANRLWTFAEHD